MRKGLLIFLLFCAIAIVTTGCFKHSYTIGNGGDVDGEAAYDSWESHWLFGIIGETEIDAKEVCPSGNATIKDRQSFLNGLVGALIGIVWSPTTVTIYCDGAGGAADQGDVEGTGDAVDDAAEEPAEAVEDEISFILTPHEMQRIALRPSTMDYVRNYAPNRTADFQAAVDTYLTKNKVALTKSSSRF